MTRQKSVRTGGRGIGWFRFLNSPIVLGGMLTWAFYQALPVLPVYRELAEQYFCSHPLAYVTTLLFFTAVAILVAKGLGLIPERRALRQLTIGRDELAGAHSDVARADLLTQQVQATGQSAAGSMLGQRILDASDFVRGRQSATGLEEHLKYLAELTADRLHQSFAMVRTITWAIPILGFLGTVIGITIAIANVTPEQLDTSLGEVTGGLAVAFDTTALALALSIVLVFAAFVVERSEQSICGQIEQFGIQRLLHVFPLAENQTDSLGSAQQQAGQRILDATDQLVERQLSAWDGQLEQLRNRWSNLLDSQSHELSQSLSSEVALSLQQHREQLDELRSSFLTQIECSIDRVVKSIRETTSDQETLRQEMVAQVTALWERLQADSESLQQAQAEHSRDLMIQMSGLSESWSEALQSGAGQSTELASELRTHGEVLLRVVEQEENLTRLQQQLVQNLDAVRAAETFEATLHSLNAAVHLLTTRVQSKAA